MSTCQIPVEFSQEKKEEGKFKKIIRRAKEAVKPTYCWVRFDANKNMWAELDQKDLMPKRHFHYGVMTNVVFEPTKIDSYGCGGDSSWAGIAKGDLVSNSYGNDAIGFHNLNFYDGVFRGEDGGEIKNAKVLRLLENRRSLYK